MGNAGNALLKTDKSIKVPPNPLIMTTTHVAKVVKLYMAAFETRSE